MVMIRNLAQQQQRVGFILKWDSYIIEVNQSGNCYNCYNCDGLRHLVCHCYNYKIVGQERKTEYGDNLNNITTNNLKVEGNQNLD